MDKTMKHTPAPFIDVGKSTFSFQTLDGYILYAKFSSANVFGPSQWVVGEYYNDTSGMRDIATINTRGGRVYVRSFQEAATGA